MLFENINFLLLERGAMPLSGEEFLSLDPDQVWELVGQLGVPFEHLNTIDLTDQKEQMNTKDIKLVVLDVDGVFTDGGMFYTSSGDEMKKFNVKDGMAIAKAISLGVEFGIISAASRSEVVELRAKILGIQNLYVGKKPKIEILESWLYEKNLSFENVAYIGDDVNDIAILEKVGIGACPNDAVHKAKMAADLILRTKGGEGCIREFIETYICDVD